MEAVLPGILKNSCSKCILIAPHYQLVAWMHCLSTFGGMQCTLLSNDSNMPGAAQHVPDALPLWHSPHAENQAVIITDAETFAADFGDRAASDTPRFNSLILIDPDDMIFEPYWSDMRMDNFYSRKADIYLSSQRGLTTLLPAFISVLQNRCISRNVDHLDPVRGYDPNVEPYTLSANDPACAYCYCRQVYQRWVIDNLTIDTQEKVRRMKDVLGMLMYDMVFGLSR